MRDFHWEVKLSMGLRQTWFRSVGIFLIIYLLGLFSFKTKTTRIKSHYNLEVPLLKIQSKEIIREGTMMHIQNVIFNSKNLEAT